MCSSRINGEGKLRWQPTNPGLPGKMAVKMVCACYVASKTICNVLMSTLNPTHSLTLGGYLLSASVSSFSHIIDSKVPTNTLKHISKSKF